MSQQVIVKCDSCRGTTRVNGVTCSKCGGTGVIMERVTESGTVRQTKILNE